MFFFVRWAIVMCMEKIEYNAVRTRFETHIKVFFMVRYGWGRNINGYTRKSLYYVQGYEPWMSKKTWKLIIEKLGRANEYFVYQDENPKYKVYNVSNWLLYNSDRQLNYVTRF